MKRAILTLSLLLSPILSHAADPIAKLTKKQVEQNLELLRSGRTPNIYGAVYYPNWKESLDGLRSIVAEKVAEHANEEMKAGKVDFEVASKPIVRGRTALVQLKRKTAGGETKIVPAYLHLDKRGKSWGLLVLPIPFKSPVPTLDKDDRFMSEALNVEHGFESKLYEFDADDLANFAELKKLAAPALNEKEKIGEMVLAIKEALNNADRPESLEVVVKYGTDSRYYTMIRGWLAQELRGTESQLHHGKNERSQHLVKKNEFLKKAIRRIDLE